MFKTPRKALEWPRTWTQHPAGYTTRGIKMVWVGKWQWWFPANSRNIFTKICPQIFGSCNSASFQKTADWADVPDDVFRQSKYILTRPGPSSSSCQNQARTNFIHLQGISAFPDGDNLLSWIGTVEGPKESVYEGLTYKLRLEFPAGKVSVIG